MGVGVVGRIISRARLGRRGRKLTMRDASHVPDVTCELHGLSPAESLQVLLPLLKRPEGVDACRECLLRLAAHKREIFDRQHPQPINGRTQRR